MEVMLDHGFDCRQNVVGITVVLRHSGPGLDGTQVGLVHLHARARHAVQAGHVVFMRMSENDEIHFVEMGADAVGHQRRVEGDARVRTLHDDLISVGVLAGFLPEINKD